MCFQPQKLLRLPCAKWKDTKQFFSKKPEVIFLNCMGEKKKKKQASMPPYYR